MHHRKDKRKRVYLIKYADVWKAYDRKEYVVAKGKTKSECKRVCERKGCAVK